MRDRLFTFQTTRHRLITTFITKIHLLQRANILGATFYYAVIDNTKYPITEEDYFRAIAEMTRTEIEDCHTH